MSQQRALVVGAGIGGLAAAVALHRRGWEVTVLERSTPAPVGAGIGLTPNGIRALDVVGAGDAVRALATWHGAGGLRTPNGRWLVRTTQDRARRRFGDPLVPVHRATLVDVLTARLPSSALHTGSAAELTDPGSADRPARVTVDGCELHAELVVAADGVRSRARRVLFPGHPGAVPAGYTTWRFVVPAPPGLAPHETWGTGALWGTQPLADGRAYAYAAALSPAGRRAPDDERAELRRRFGTWHDPVPALVEAAEPGDVLRHDVQWLAEPLPALHRGRTVLVGDAAHALHPCIGQGGNLALEDAVTLAAAADPAAAAAAEAPAAYTAQRLARTTDVVRRSAAAARTALVASRPRAAARNTLVALLGRTAPGLVLRAFDGVLDWEPPRPAYAARVPEKRPS